MSLGVERLHVRTPSSRYRQPEGVGLPFIGRRKLLYSLARSNSLRLTAPAFTGSNIIFVCLRLRSSEENEAATICSHNKQKREEQLMNVIN